MSINKAIENIFEGKLDEMRQNFSAAITSKAVEKLEERKIQIAENYFGQLDELKGGYDLGRAASDGPEMNRMYRGADAAAGRVGFNTSKPQKAPKKSYSGIGYKMTDDESYQARGSKVVRQTPSSLKENQLDELRNFKNEKDVLGYVAKARKQIKDMDAYDVSPEGDKKMETGKKRIRGMQLLVKKAEKAKKKG